MRRGVVIAAILTTIATVWMLIREQEPSAVVRAISRGTGPQLSDTAGSALATRRPLPGLNENPFGVPPPPPAPPPPAPVTAAPPPPPQRPPFSYQYFGRLTNANGELDTYLHHNGRLVAVQKGLALESGYVVDSVSEAQIVIRHQSSRDIVRIDLPTFRGQ